MGVPRNPVYIFRDCTGRTERILGEAGHRCGGSVCISGLRRRCHGSRFCLVTAAPRHRTGRASGPDQLAGHDRRLSAGRAYPAGGRRSAAALLGETEQSGKIRPPDKIRLPGEFESHGGFDTSGGFRQERRTEKKHADADYRHYHTQHPRMHGRGAGLRHGNERPGKCISVFRRRCSGAGNRYPKLSGRYGSGPAADTEWNRKEKSLLPGHHVRRGGTGVRRPGGRSGGPDYPVHAPAAGIRRWHHDLCGHPGAAAGSPGLPG